jgi:putative transposase
VPIVTDEIYHVYSRSISDHIIFKNSIDYSRMVKEFSFYSIAAPPCKFSMIHKISHDFTPNMSNTLSSPKRLVDILAYCIMPTHIHLVLKQLAENGISRFMRPVLKSYSQYFNLKYKRNGPLWDGRFKNVLVKNDEQLLHLHRYIHLNPVTKSIVNDPKDWNYSSYREYLGKVNKNMKLCNFSNYFKMKPSSYENFVKDRIDYQRKLAFIKYLTLE